MRKESKPKNEAYLEMMESFKPSRVQNRKGKGSYKRKGGKIGKQEWSGK